MKFNLTLPQKLSILFLLGLLISVFLGLVLVRQSQDIRKKAAGVSATLSFYPSKENFSIGEEKYFDLIATFSEGSSVDKIDYFKTEVKFTGGYLSIPSSKYVDTEKSGLDKIFRVDGPVVSNENKKIIIEVGANTPGSGPTTDRPVTLARIYFSGKTKTPSPQEITIGNTQVVSNHSSAIPVTLQGLTYTVGTVGADVTTAPTPPKERVTISFEPYQQVFKVGETGAFFLKATFPEGSLNEKIDYFKTEVNFQTEYLQVPSGMYVETSSSGLDKIFRVDGPTVANGSGKIVIELGASTPGTGPSTDKPITIAKIYFAGKKNTPSSQDISLTKTHMVNNKSKSMLIIPQIASYLVGEGPISPPPGGDDYEIDVGSKQSLVLNIGPSTSAQIRFKAKLSHLQNTPEMYLKLRVKDELAFINTKESQTTNDSCNNTPVGAYDFWVPVKADKNGVYTPNPNPSSTLQTPASAKGASVTSDGWVILDGVSPGRYHAFFLKGPKTRSTRTVQHIMVQPGKPQQQDFDWTTTTLDPGDLPDPNKGFKQDCTVNSIDLSLITGRLGKTDSESLSVADVNYDAVINGNDVSKVVNTLSTKPDDDI